MRPSRYLVRPTGGSRVYADTADLGRAKEYAKRWARATQVEMDVVDSQPPGLAWGVSLTQIVVHVETPPSQHGVPLPRPLNPPPAEEGW